MLPCICTVLTDSEMNRGAVWSYQEKLMVAKKKAISTARRKWKTGDPNRRKSRGSGDRRKPCQYTSPENGGSTAENDLSDGYPVS